MKPILIHCHIYYPELWSELKSRIKNINPHPFKLYVTMVGYHKEIISDINRTFKEANIEILENRGYDIGPFIYVINKVNLDEYSYVIKLHTKRDVSNKSAFRGLDGTKWRDALLSFLKSPEIFGKYLDVFNHNPVVGMQASYVTIFHHEHYDRFLKKSIKQFWSKNEMPFQKYAFVAGTMFIARSYLFKDIQCLNLSLNDFPDPKGEHETQLAHVIERFLGYIVYKNHMILIDGILTKEQEERYHKNFYNKKRFYSIIRFIFQKKITKSGKKIIKICKIPIIRQDVSL